MTGNHRIGQSCALSGALLLLWAACDEPTKSPLPPPVSRAPATPPAPSVTHTVSEGETLWDIAQAYGVTVEAIRRENSMEGQTIRPAQSVRIPGVAATTHVTTAAERQAARAALPQPTDGAFHFLAEGETLWDVARLYDKGIDEIVARNELTDDDVRALRPGHPIVIPGLRRERVRVQPPVRPAQGARHTMAAGETVWDLAARYDVAVAQIMAANGLDPTEVTSLREGQALTVPGVTSVQRPDTARTPSERRNTAVARRLGLGTRAVAGQLLVGRPNASWVMAAGGANPPGTLRWPVTNGWFVRGFGSGLGGYHLATDIMGEIGWNVRAAAPGIVGYSGNGMRGFGNVVLVIHPGGWITLYAHNSVNFAVAGQRVDRGSILAEVGSTGISRGPHVHFELIHDGKNCDPSALFRPGIRHRDGHLSPMDRLSWTRPSEPPRGLRCFPRRRFPGRESVQSEDPTEAGAVGSPELNPTGL